MYNIYVKRLLDCILSLIIIILLGWLILLIGLVVLISDGRPIIYSQDRCGYKGKIFRIYKFRTMVKDADKIGSLSTAPMDKRVTKIGKILRKTSMDELPQLFNILKGDMSFVGFRPGVPENYEQHDYESGMFNVRPGITGYAQVNGRSDLTLQEKREWELKYVQDISFITDLKILMQTVHVVLKRGGTN